MVTQILVLSAEVTYCCLTAVPVISLLICPGDA
jgi:hypothetical protein